jgi:5-hydroxyisourate hydrolase
VSGLTTHVLDAVRGCGAAGMRVRLKRGEDVLADVRLDETGRARLAETLEAGAYELLFHAGDYQDAKFFDVIPVRFQVVDAAEHYHVPLILSAFGYSTYRGG